MPPKPHHGPHAGWLSNYEQNLPLSEGLELLRQVIAALSENGEVDIEGVHVKPQVEANFIIRHEQAPHGEFKLKLEIEWEPGSALGTPSGRKPTIR